MVKTFDQELAETTKRLKTKVIQIDGVPVELYDQFVEISRHNKGLYWVTLKEVVMKAEFYDRVTNDQVMPMESIDNEPREEPKGVLTFGGFIPER